LGEEFDAFDRFVRLGRRPFTIIGVVEFKGQSTTGQDHRQQPADAQMLLESSSKDPLAD